MPSNIVSMGVAPSRRPLLAKTGGRVANSYELRKSLIMLVASRIEPDHGVLEHWFSREPIVTLDNRTAKEMLILGLDDLVVHFLLGIIHGERRSHGR